MRSPSKSFSIVMISLIIGVFITSSISEVKAQVSFPGSNTETPPTREEDTSSDIRKNLIRTTFSPNETANPWDSNFGCTIGEYIDESGKVIVDRNNPKAKYCSTNPFWIALINALFLSGKGPEMLDADKINGQRFLKGSTSFGSSITGTPLYLHGLFPLEKNLTYQQLVPSDVDTFTVPEIKELANIYPNILPTSDIKKTFNKPDTVEGGITTMATYSRDEVVNGLNQLLLPTFSNLEYLTFYVVKYGAVLFPGIDTATFRTTEIGQNVSTKIATLIERNGSTIPAFNIPKDATYNTTTNQDATSHYDTYSSPNFVLSPVFSLFTDTLERKIRPKADFFCKSGLGFLGSDFKIDGDIPFVTNGWKQTCASLGKNGENGAGFVDTTFSTHANIIGIGDITTNYLTPQSALAAESIGNQDTDHMDWFAAAGHCMSRGGRLPRTDELLYMAQKSMTATSSDQVSYFQDSPHTVPNGTSSGYYGSYVFADDFVYGRGGALGTDVPSVMTLFLPSRNGGNPDSGWGGTSPKCESLLSIFDLSTSDIKNTNSVVDWSNAKLCEYRMDHIPAPFESHYVSSGRNTIVMNAVTDPAATEQETEYLPAGYQKNAQGQYEGLSFLSPAGRQPSTNVVCVYE